MADIIFKWDKRKNRINIEKHGVSFEEAKSVFYDENAIEFYDFEHSKNEERFFLLGLSSHLRILLICHCFKEKDSVIRIISARKATKKEQKIYFGGE